MLKLKKIEKNFYNSLKNYIRYYKSDHWRRYDDRIELFKIENLLNFRNNGLSNGLDDQKSTIIIKKELSLLNKIINDKFIKNNLLTTNFGNLKNFIKVKKKFLDSGQLYFIYWLYLLKKNLKKIEYICEIGAGFGGFSAKVLKAYSKAKYLIIDLPEANFLSSYFLSKNFPNKKILLGYEKKEETIYKSDFNKYDIIIIPPWFRVEGVKFDLFINTRSMMEMDKEVIFKYFEFIHNNISNKGYFFNVNRYFKDTVREPLKLTNYPYDINWNTIISKPSWQQKHIRILLTQRSKNPKNSISEELKKLEKITEKYFLLEKKNKIAFFKKIYYLVKKKLYLIYKYFI
jgi:putative sugar O-methyltransferase